MRRCHVSVQVLHDATAGKDHRLAREAKRLAWYTRHGEPQCYQGYGIGVREAAELVEDEVVRIFDPLGRRESLASLLIVGVLGLAACAAPGPSGDHPNAVAAQARRLVLVEIPMAGDDPRIRKQFAQGADEAVQAAQSAALSDVRQALEQEGLAIDDREATLQAVRDLGVAGAASVTPDAAERLHALSGDDVLLRFRVTDYGATPRAWRNGYIAFEVTSTLGIAAVAYAYPATRALAGAYLVQEGIEETAEGYAGFWALDEVCRPVRIRAELLSLPGGDRIWKGSATGLSDIHPARLVRKVGDAEQATQRRRAMRQAAEKVARALEDFLQKQQ